MGFRYRIRLGTSDLEGIHSDGGIERRVKDIRWHPKYKPGRVYFDAGVVIASKLVTFTAFVRPVCLPYLPVDYEDEFEGKFVTLYFFIRKIATAKIDFLVPVAAATTVVTVKPLLGHFPLLQ